MRRLLLIAAAAASVLLGLVGNLATGTLELPRAWTPWVWGATVLLGAAVVAAALLSAPPPARPAEPDLAGLSRRLAARVRAQWEAEEERQGVSETQRIPVAWEAADGVPRDHWAAVRMLPPGAGAGADAGAAPPALAGRLDRRENVVGLYRGLPSRRLVVLGRAGAGKTVLAMQLVLGLIGCRAADDPVPVLLGVGSWDAGAVEFRTWLAAQLARDHPELAAPGPDGENLAAHLVNGGRVLPVLDGFDELAEGLHRPALERLRRTTLPFVLTGRHEEYARAVRAHGVLTAAAVVALADLTAEDLARYLRRVAPPGADAGTAGQWEAVLAHLAGPAGAPLGEILSTPLAVGLARTVYTGSSGRSPAELVTARVSGLEDRLVREYLTTVYAWPRSARHGRPGSWHAERARRWLTHLAVHLDRLGTGDLAWWQLRDTVPRTTRIPVLGALIGLVTALPLAGVTGPGVASAFGAAAGLAFGLAAGRPEHGPEPVRTRLRLRGRRRDLLEHLALGLGTGFALTLGLGLGLKSALVGGLAFGVIAGAVSGVSGNLTHSRGDATGEPFEVLRADRAAGLAAGLPNGLAAGLLAAVLADRVLPLTQALLLGAALGLGFLIASGVTTGTTFGILVGVAVSRAVDHHMWLNGLEAALIVIGAGTPLVLMVGLAAGPTAGIGFGAWAQWLLLVRLWLPLTGRLPWSVTTFLADAHGRGVLLRSGAVLRFRHARLQDHLLGRLGTETSPPPDPPRADPVPPDPVPPGQGATE
ncbi:NACHT domain-containing protein [Streptomyces sp. SS8]